MLHWAAFKDTVPRFTCFRFILEIIELVRSLQVAHNVMPSSYSYSNYLYSVPVIASCSISYLSEHSHSPQASYPQLMCNDAWKSRFETNRNNEVFPDRFDLINFISFLWLWFPYFFFNIHINFKSFSSFLSGEQRLKSSSNMATVSLLATALSEFQLDAETVASELW